MDIYKNKLVDVFLCWFIVCMCLHAGFVCHTDKNTNKNPISFILTCCTLIFEFTTNIKYLYYQHLMKQLVSQFIFIVQNSTHLRSFHLHFKSISKITSNSLVKINNNIRRKAFVHRTTLNINHELKILEYKL